MQAQRGKASQRLCTCTVELCMLAMVITLCSRRVSQPVLSVSAGGSLYSRPMESLPCLCSTLSTVSVRMQVCRCAKAGLEKEGAVSRFLSYSVFALTFTTLIMRRIRVISSNSLSIIVKLHVPFLRLVLLALIWGPTAQPPVPGSVMARAARLVLIGPPRTGFRRCRRRLRRDTPKHLPHN